MHRRVTTDEQHVLWTCRLVDRPLERGRVGATAAVVNGDRDSIGRPGRCVLTDLAADLAGRRVDVEVVGQASRAERQRVGVGICRAGEE